MSSLLRAEGAAHLAKPATAEPEADPGRRRRRIRRALIGLNVFLATCVLLVGSGLAYGYVQFQGRLNRVDIPRGNQADAILPNVPKGAPVNILVVGSDARSAAKEARDKRQFGTGKKVDGQRSDTMMVIRLDPKNDKATILSIPRDTYVDLEGGGKGRINEAFANVKDSNKADPDRLIRTITKNFGVPINHYVEIDFFGFRDAVNAVGGVKVWFEYPSRDDYSLLSIPNAGCIPLNGDSALSYVRSRHFEYKQNGRWKTDPSSDFGRIKRQQDFIRRLVRKAVADGLITNPVRAHRLIEAGIDNVTVDSGFGLMDMKSLASQLKNLNEGGLTFLSVPGTPIMIGNDSVLRLDKEGANEVLVAFGAKPLTTTTTKVGKAPPAPAQKIETGVPAGTTVRIYNTTTRGGLASSTARALGGFGVASTAGGNKAAVPATQIRHPAGAEGAATALQALVGGGATLQADPTVRKGELLLLIGPNFTAIQPPPSATTTAAPAAAAPAPTITTSTTAPAVGSDPSKLC